MTHFTHKTVFWSLFALTSIGAIFFSAHYFSRAFPIVNLDIRMSRTQALEHAATLTKHLNIGPSIYKQTALFSTDSTVQTYVELEAGGAAAYNLMVTGNLYSPYTWQVRHFTPGETEELIILFKPDGTPYGFIETIAEKALGDALTMEQAEEIARRDSSEKWHINFTDYTRVETSKEIKPNGRIDHTFVYERKEHSIGKATYRLRLIVSGNKLTTVTHFIKVPEEFTHRYQEMRSANNTIAQAANLAYMILYILGVGILGFYFLLRKKSLIWKTALLLACIKAFLTGCAALSNFPLYWFFYVTTTPTNTFIIKYIFSTIITVMLDMATSTAIFMVAEGLTRLALPTQGQLWRTWSVSDGSSLQTLGRTLASYLLVPLYFADVVIFYMLTMQYLGWWTPAAQLTDPNILACYIPWINAIAPSFSAGFLEECIFRAFPLAAAILLGRRYGKQNWWIACAFIIQILIFGAAHANYATQPAYARLVELVAFSSLMGIIYLKFGLLIGIISHAIYDLVWFALPLFITCTPYAWINQLFVILIGMLPLLIIFIRRLQKGFWHTIDRESLNESWTNPEPIKEHAPRIVEHITQRSFSTNHTYMVMCIGFLGLTVWIICTQFYSNSPAIKTTRTEAITNGNKALLTRDINIDTQWTPFSYVGTFNSPTMQHTGPGVSSIDQHRFIWQKGGESLYKSLLGTYLQPAHWRIRFLKFNGSVSERAEGYLVALTDTKISCINHILPEDRKGAQLTEAESRIIAHKALRELYNREPETYMEISAVSEKHPDRIDWDFTFADLQQTITDNGQARVLITVAGNVLTNNCCYIHVPEEWVRRQETERSVSNLINMICYSLLLALLLIASILVFRGTHFLIQPRYVIATFVIIFTIFAAQTINSLPTIFAQMLNSQEPYTHQLFRLLSGIGFGLLCSAGAYTFAIIMVIQYARATIIQAKTTYKLYGISLGICWTGLTALLKRLTTSLEPFWGDFSCLGTYLPTTCITLNTVSKFIIETMLTLLLLFALNIFAKNRNRYFMQIPLLLCIGFVLVGIQPIITMEHFVITSLVTSLFFIVAYYNVLTHMPACVPWIIATTLSCHIIQQAILNVYPAACIGNSIAFIVVIITALLSEKILTRSLP